MVARGGVLPYEPHVAGEVAYWVELRPAESGRNVVVRADPGSSPIDITPTGFDARTRVHEYGGGAYTVHDGTVFFTNFVDQRLYRQELGSTPAPITPEPPTPASLRYADMRTSPDGRFIVCVRERHEGEEIPTNELVVLAADGSVEPWMVAAGRDFYAFPRVSADGRRVAWIEWDMPQMPWDGTELKVAELREDGTFGEPRLVAGGSTESIFQPDWSPDGVLHFVSDRTGWWNLYRETEDGAKNLTPVAAEFGVPMWEFGYSAYTFLDDGRIACLYRRDGIHHLAMLDPATSELLDLDLPFSCYEPPYVVASGTRLVFVSGGPAIPTQIVSLDFVTRSVEILRESRELDIDARYFSVPRAIEFPADGGLTAHAWFYAPANRTSHRPRASARRSS